jgi:hypothetical protein
METTRDLPDDSMRAATARGRVKLPLVECAHEARPNEEMVPERVAEVLLAEETGEGCDASR